MPLPALDVVPLSRDQAPADALASVPAGPGVAQILGPEGGNLVLSPASNLRKWLSSRLGCGPAAAPGRRPKTDLSGVATGVAFVRTRGSFEQRLVFERLMAALVPTASRRDLKRPAFLHLDPGERFPRLEVRDEATAPVGEGRSFGPFAHRRAAEKARDAVNRLFALRPCDFDFEPDPALPLGLGCLYAQVRSCAAPCLSRTGEDEYRASARRAVEWMSHPAARPDAPAAVPETVGEAGGGRALVVDAGRKEVFLYPVRGGRVLEDAMVATSVDTIPDAVGRLAWPTPAEPADWPWLAGFVAGKAGRGAFVVVGDRIDPDALVSAVRTALPRRLVHPVGGDDGNVRSSRGDD